MRRKIPYGSVHSRIYTDEIAEYCPCCKQPINTSFWPSFPIYKTRPLPKDRINEEKRSTEERATAMLLKKINATGVAHYEITHNWSKNKIRENLLDLHSQAWEIID